MARSFGIVEHKLFETDFFLDKFEESINKKLDLQGMNFYFSAFLTARNGCSIFFSHKPQTTNDGAGFCLQTELTIKRVSRPAQ